MGYSVLAGGGGEGGESGGRVMRVRDMLAVLATALSVVGQVSCAGSDKEESMLRNKKVVIVIASRNFRDEEFVEPNTLLTSRGAEVTVACSKLEASRGTRGATVKPDVLRKAGKAAD